MDDLFHGADTIGECKEQIRSIVNVFSKGHLPLTKWMSNNAKVLDDIEIKKKMESYIQIDPENGAVKTLGILYSPFDDVFGFQVKPFTNLKFTKRSMLSMSASLYDPIGWILPVIMMFRILLQKLWSMDVNWDDRIEGEIRDKFVLGIESLPYLQQLKIPRWISCSKDDKVTLVGFSDASGNGIAGVVYSRVQKGDKYVISLLASKGRVTPLKTLRNQESKLCTIPKMELEALALLSLLMSELKSSFIGIKLECVAYTDSNVVLAWLRRSEEVENKFVKKRIRQIKKILAPGAVHYVKSTENPADAASRGLCAKQFVQNKELWLTGPEWMKNDKLPSTPFEESVTTHVTEVKDEFDFAADLIERFSSFSKLISCVSIILLWVQVVLHKNKAKSADLMAKSRKIIITLQQKSSFEKELSTLRKGSLLPKTHWMSCLCPFVDSEGILRVGGRLDRAHLPTDQKHPMLIPKGHLARLIVRDIHIKNGHSAILLTDSILKQSYWVTNSRNIIRHEIRHCLTCLRFKADTRQPQMSDLPHERITPSPIFDNTAVDFCGPFNIRPSKLKFEKIIKCWVAVFVCLSSKLVHLELCLELSAENFLSAFDRFTSRRSTPSQMLSDNGTNFVGANRILIEQFKELVKKGIKWNFIPPGSPHFGGLHESCVKSFKYFVKRMGKIESLTYEEFHTLVCRIEALLNSRPLYPMSTDANDQLALTPGHFAVQRPLKAPPTSNGYTRPSFGISKRWIMVQKLQLEFWNRFQKEYLSTLQKRLKWIQPQKNLAVDDVVILKDNLIHPLNWPLGRIVKTHPDQKGIVRKVDIKTSNNTVVNRAVNKLIPLITEEDEAAAKKSVPRTRKQRKRTSSFLTTLILNLVCILSISSTTNTATIESLSPGVHIRLLQKVYVKSITIDFKLQTNVNISADISLMGSEIASFLTFCNNNLENKYKKLVEQCLERHSFLQQEAQLTEKFIKGLYNPIRQKRWSFLAKMATKSFAIKAAPYAAFTATTAWQEYSNWQQKRRLEKVDEKFKKVSFILFNLTETENVAVHEELDRLVDQQKQLIWEAEINSYVSAIQALTSSMKTRHEGLINIRPHQELNNFIQSINQQQSIVDIPLLQNSDDIFNIYPITMFLTEDLATLQYKIPLVKPEPFYQYAVISIPFNQEQIVILDNKLIVQEIVFNKDNSSYFYPEQVSEIFPSIYDDVKLQSMTSCSSTIIKQNQFNDCSFGSWDNMETKVFYLGNHSALILNAEHNQISLNCPNKNFTLPLEFSFVHYNGCHFHGIPLNESQFLEVDVDEIAHSEELHSNFSIVNITQQTGNQYKETIAKLKDDFLHTISTDDTKMNWATIGILLLGLLLATIILVTIRNRQQAEIAQQSGATYNRRSPSIELSNDSWTTPYQLSPVPPEVV